jgi:hypothetical protein
LWYQALDCLHDGLELDDVHIQIDVLNHSVIGCLCIGCFGSPDGWVSIGNVPRRRPDGAHYADTMGPDSFIPVDVAPNLRVVFSGVPISGRS